ncbi:adenosylcobinamide-GDP ribazoletransferase [Glaciimonas sp. PAMC28666]|uniref:adenosylcobinamide-GDP ribazoletransferase n=1 Tax=Glaciimonas sp. PAMC28666 TaxID=2807626 RepID=UPI0019630FDA|nr:adenosylcobinamide-GDP ribazoletransferase [Glaciimonas sp. PAMC28666]QRX82771.1 adenosylcobinamide-GDP ribazoletransferase [Glaciimonas sp. PAMC28666]
MSDLQPSASRSQNLTRSVCHQVRLFFIALQFFTRLPIPRRVGFDPAWLQQASRYFSAVGIVVGAITAAIYAVCTCLWPTPVAVLLSTIVGIYLTGAFHEDGFADVCDGFGGGFGASCAPARILEIMKDSRVGAYGVIGVVLMLGLKCTLLASLPWLNVVAALLMAHPFSRLMASLLIWQMTYVRAEGKAKPLAQEMSGTEWGIAAIFAALPLIAMGCFGWAPWAGILAGMLCSGIATLWFARFFVKRIGGYTGDCLGAVQQAAEVAFYLGLLAAVPLLK